MDDLWGPPTYYQDPEDTDSLRFPYDVIEDSAINEKCCIQVLNILISKQDTDISELQDELMELLGELACTDVEFSDMVSMSLKAHVDFLDSSVTKLKDGAGDFSSTSRQPADSINDIMKSLFSSYLRKKNHQFADKTGNVSSSYEVPAVNPSGKKKRTSSSSNVNQLKFSDKIHNVSSSYQVPAVSPSGKKKQTSSSSNVNQLESAVKTYNVSSSYQVPAVNPSGKKKPTSGSSNANILEFADKTHNVSGSYQVTAVNPSGKKKQTSSPFYANQLECADKTNNVSTSYQVPAVNPSGKKKRTSSPFNANQLEFADKTHNVSGSYQVPAVNPSGKKKRTSSSFYANHLECADKTNFFSSSYQVPAVNPSGKKKRTSSPFNANQLEFADKTHNVSGSYQMTAENSFEKNKRTSSSSNVNQMEFADKTHNVSSSYQVPAVNPSGKKKRTGSSSSTSQLEKSEIIIISTFPQTRVKTEEDDSIYPYMNPLHKYSAQGPFHSSLEKTNKWQKKPQIITENDVFQNNTPKCKSICQKPSLESQGKLKMVESQPDDETIGPLSICVVDSNQEPAEKQNTTRDLVLFDGESNSENHHHQQQPNVSISSGKRSFKRREIMTSKLMASARFSPLLLEGQVKKYERNYYTVPELRAICKERELKGYSKFRKVELAELLGIELIEGIKPKKEAEKKGDTVSSKDTGWP